MTAAVNQIVRRREDTARCAGENIIQSKDRSGSHHCNCLGREHFSELRGEQLRCIECIVREVMMK